VQAAGGIEPEPRRTAPACAGAGLYGQCVAAVWPEFAARILRLVSLLTIAGLTLSDVTVTRGIKLGDRYYPWRKVLQEYVRGVDTIEYLANAVRQ
jgi:hypothetical protein